jgi:hypothetical protein
MRSYSAQGPPFTGGCVRALNQGDFLAGIVVVLVVRFEWVPGKALAAKATVREFVLGWRAFDDRHVVPALRLPHV